MAFGVCLPPFSLTQPIILKHSTIERGFQKPPFCVAKVWFLACKKWVFALQKYGFCFLRECFLFCNTPYRTHVTPPKWRCDSYHFDTSKPFGSDCKTGAMNRPLRLTECSLLYICAINGYYGMFVAIYLCYPFRYFYLL